MDNARTEILRCIFKTAAAMYFEMIIDSTAIALLPIMVELLMEYDEEDDEYTAAGSTNNQPHTSSFKTRLEAHLEAHISAVRAASAPLQRRLDDRIDALLLSHQPGAPSTQHSAQPPHIAPTTTVPVPTSNFNTAETRARNRDLPGRQPQRRGVKRKRKRGGREQQAASGSDDDEGEEFSSATERSVKRWRDQVAASEASIPERHCIFDDRGYFDTHSLARCDGYGIYLPICERGMEGG